MRPDSLPIDAHLDEIRRHLAESRALVLSAAPGAGKTTRVAPALVDAGPVVVLQPRRVAARAIAHRIALERGWTVGREIGWQVRFDRRFSSETRLLVVTEGVLTSRLQRDALLSDFATVVFDEFHERSIHADVGLALARQAWLARDDLRLLVMSATFDGADVARFLGDCPVVEVPGARHALTVEHAPGVAVPEAVASRLTRATGHVLCFLPGAREIERARQALLVDPRVEAEVVPLHGSLDAEAQDLAIRRSARRRVVLATNIAETSLTVPGVTVVIDTGEVKVARYDAARGVDSLRVERVTEDSADQRAGRAAREAPGLVVRLWNSKDRLRPHREPDVARVDLAGPLLDVLAWGGRLETFEWFEAPAAERIDAGLRLLERLGAVERTSGACRVTALGRQMQRLPLHPRLARILIDGRGAPAVADACAWLSEPSTRPARTEATTSDVLAIVDDFERQPAHVRRVAGDLRRLARENVDDGDTRASERDIRHALFTGFADRLAKRRPGTADRFTLASGHGASLGRESLVVDAELIVALDVVAAQRDGHAESRIRVASRVEAEWLTPTASEVEHRLDAESGRVRAARVTRYGAIVLGEVPVPVDPTVAAQVLADAWLARPRDARSLHLMRRLAFAGLDIDVPALVLSAALEASTLEDIDLDRHLPVDVERRLADAAPLSLVVPSGRSTPLDYPGDGSVAAAVKLQELFGLAASPAIGPRRVPVTFHLLAPNGRPVQTTRDLRSFWERTYPDVRRELRGRYPKHPWPEDPWTARPTHRTTRRPPE
ncbi:MAG: ATP-dependent helicase C-terminal domain-containing protein [Vicinamibacterales bacterium]